MRNAPLRERRAGERVPGGVMGYSHLFQLLRSRERTGDRALGAGSGHEHKNDGTLSL
jgi:hypothetical protein